MTHGILSLSTFNLDTMPMVTEINTSIPSTISLSGATQALTSMTFSFTLSGGDTFTTGD